MMKDNKSGFNSLNTIELAFYRNLFVATVVKTLVQLSKTLSKAEHAFERALQKQGKAKYVDFLQTELACFVLSPAKLFRWFEDQGILQNLAESLPFLMSERGIDHHHFDLKQVTFCKKPKIASSWPECVDWSFSSWTFWWTCEAPSCQARVLSCKARYLAQWGPRRWRHGDVFWLKSLLTLSRG